MIDFRIAPPREDLVGVWLLISYVETSQSWPQILPFGAEPVGVLIYTADGFVSAQLMRPNRRNLDVGGWDAEPLNELGKAASDYIAYSGTYHVDVELCEVVHVPLVALVPNLISNDQKRRFAILDGDLQLTTDRIVAGGEVVKSQLTWRRAPAERPSVESGT